MEQAKKKEDIATQPDVSARGYFWFVAQGNLLKGPYTTQELKKLVEKKEISERFFAWRDGYREWRPLYGIDEFHLDKHVESSYPSVPIPGQLAASSGVMARTVNRPDPTRMPTIRVKFSHTRWTDMKKTEVIGLFLISLAFALCFLFLSLRVFEQQWSQVWGRRTAGMVYNLGAAPEALPAYMYDPLLTAPGLKNLDEEWVAVEVEGNMNRFEPQKLEGMNIETHVTKEAMMNLDWDTSNTFTRRMKVRGYIDLLKSDNVIEIEQPGLPFEPALSGRARQ